MTLFTDEETEAQRDELALPPPLHPPCTMENVGGGQWVLGSPPCDLAVSL